MTQTAVKYASSEELFQPMCVYVVDSEHGYVDQVQLL